MEYFKQDPWKEIKGGTCWAITKDGTRLSMSYPLIFICRGIPVASIVEVIYENVVPRELLCRVQPAIASIHLPQPILDKIPEWTSRPPEDKRDLCKEIREFCERNGWRRRFKCLFAEKWMEKG